MKVFRILSMLLTVIALWSCSNNDEVIPEQEETKTYEIKMSLGGEYVETSESPLSRTETPKKYYGVNVYCMKDDGKTNSYNYYAYGVFDNVEDMKITLLGGYKYKFECTSVEDGEDKIYSNNTSLYEPFCDEDKSFSEFSLSKLNSFIVSSTKNLFGIKLGATHILRENGTSTTSISRTNRYYGEVENFIPTKSESVTISMKRTVFGVKFIINEVPDGVISWDMSTICNNTYLSPNLLYTSHSGNSTLEFSSIYTFPDVYKSWKDDNYSLNFNIEFIWARSNGYNQSFSKTVSVKRNVMTNVNVNLEGGSSEVSLGINEENTQMTNETIDINFNGGSLSDTNVNPEE